VLSEVGASALKRVPSTALQLLEMAGLAGADARVWLGADATELRLWELSRSGELARARILAFATHAVTESSEFGEPGLVFTGLDRGAESERNNGFLSARESSALALDADLVILAGCNTAGRGTARDEVLSGLGQAFFFAGARSLLVSHWSADDEATMRLMQRFMEAHADSVGTAEAMRRAQLRLLNPSVLERMWARVLRRTEPSHYAAPFFWAPFVVAGDGNPR
jgi:CHAT domain-containing protein